MTGTCIQLPVCYCWSTAIDDDVNRIPTLVLEYVIANGQPARTEWGGPKPSERVYREEMWRDLVVAIVVVVVVSCTLCVDFFHNSIVSVHFVNGAISWSVFFSWLPKAGSKQVPPAFVSQLKKHCSWYCIRCECCLLRSIAGVEFLSASL